MERASTANSKRRIVRDIGEILSDEDDIKPPSKKIKKEQETEPSTKKTKKGVIDSPDSPTAPVLPVKLDTETTYYRLNHDKFHLYMRSEEIINLARKRFNESAAKVMHSLCEQASIRVHGCKGFVRSAPIKIHTLLQTLDEYSLVVEGDGPALQSYLDALEKDEVQFIYKDDETDGGAYSVRFNKISEALKERVIEDVLFSKYNMDGVRIWRCLKQGKLDDKQVHLYQHEPLTTM
jgi:hypothetical protein